ncbi:MAG: hypothetical protein MJZ60_10040 [Bacteroidaceae bacterium]|nr:hypothetical protein [Bacteroidaceae bacterium]
MANKRNLKKNINYICAELLAECVASMQYTKACQEDINNVMFSIIDMQNDMTCRISHMQPGMKACDFVKKMRDDMSKRTDEIIDQINALL